MRFDDLLIDGPGILAEGGVELDANGDMQTANFPVFATSDGDKATLRADRASDGALRVVLRGDVYDGRTFVKSSMSGPPATRRARASRPTSISTSSSAWWPAITARRCAASICGCRAATAASAASA